MMVKWYMHFGTYAMQVTSFKALSLINLSGIFELKSLQLNIVE